MLDSESAPHDFLRTGDGRTYADLIEPAGLGEISTYTHVLAPHKDLVIPRTPNGALGEPTRLVGQAHRPSSSGPSRAERRFLPTATDLPTELTRFAALGIEGVFADHPDIVITTLKQTALNV